MPRFILADQSLVSLGGHHYEFAQNVLNAAAESGGIPVLASHREFRLPRCGRWPVRPTYRDGLWTHQAGNRPLRALGYAVSALRRGGAAAKPLAALAARGRDLWRARRFALDTRQLLEELAVCADDLVFIPNATLVEVSALADLLKTFPAARRAAWHLEFHMHIFPRGAPHRTDAFAGARDVQAALRALRAAAEGARLGLHTDTEELTQQYEALEAGSFTTLPIPVDPVYRPPAGKSDRAAGAPLRFAYIGDARVEKGYPQLPDMIRRVWGKLVAPGRVQFVIQSNCRAARSEREALEARAELSGLGAPAVKLLTEPLNTDAYRSLVLESDAVLLPYDPDSYEARSSGILSEALAAGKPVAVPDGTWMARQVPEGVGVVHPFGAAGMAAAVDRLADEFDRFCVAARDFARVWSERHDPRRLVAMLRDWPPLASPHFALRCPAVSDT